MMLERTHIGSAVVGVQGRGQEEGAPQLHPPPALMLGGEEKSRIPRSNCWSEYSRRLRAPPGAARDHRARGVLSAGGVLSCRKSTQRTRRGLGTVTPILRMFDEAMAREFYLDFLGFQVD
jgi:hypothetical protein